MKISKMRLLATTAPLAAVLLSTPSFAQEETSDGAGIEEIIVTAQRREENLQDVPLSVTAVSGDKLDAISAGGVDIRGRGQQYLACDGAGGGRPRASRCPVTVRNADCHTARTGGDIACMTRPAPQDPWSPPIVRRGTDRCPW